jgi:hypothetical protein
VLFRATPTALVNWLSSLKKIHKPAIRQPRFLPPPSISLGIPTSTLGIFAEGQRLAIPLPPDFRPTFPSSCPHPFLPCCRHDPSLPPVEIRFIPATSSSRFLTVKASLRHPEPVLPLKSPSNPPSRAPLGWLRPPLPLHHGAPLTGQILAFPFASVQ